MFPPDPGGAEQSQIGGNIATNAGGPHAFKYGVTGKWVTGLEAAVPPGELDHGRRRRSRKDVAGYDLKSLLIGSEGTLGIVTAAWLRLDPRARGGVPVVGLLRRHCGGLRAIERVLGNGLAGRGAGVSRRRDAAAAGASFPVGCPPDAGFLVIAEADGSAAEAARLPTSCVAALGEGALAVAAPSDAAEVAALWRWRDGVSFAVTAQRGAKVSEDIVVPLDRLAEAIEGTLEIGRRHGLPACSWGHAGDGNLHSTFLSTADDPDELGAPQRAADELLAMALGWAAVSGEHGLGSSAAAGSPGSGASGRLGSTARSSVFSIRRGS